MGNDVCSAPCITLVRLVGVIHKMPEFDVNGTFNLNSGKYLNLHRDGKDKQ